MFKLNLKYLSLNLFLFIAFYSNAQDSLKTISGKIIDLHTKVPVGFAIINDLNTNKTVQSDKDGAFKIKYKSNELILVIRKLGYETQTISINSVTKTPLIINLKAQSLDISEVIISANKPVKRLIDNSFYVLDYQFVDSNILLLGEVNNKNVLKIIDKDGKELQKLTLNSIKSESLFKDCFGNIHLLTENNTFQVYLNDNEIDLLDKIRRSLFDSILKPCIINTNDHLYFEAIYNNGQMKTITVMNKTTKQKSDFGIFSDEFKAKLINNEYAFIDMKHGYTDDNVMGDLDKDALRATRRKQMDIDFFENIINTSAYIPIILNNDTITVLNHPNDLIHRYTLNNKEVKLQAMEYHHYKNWKPHVVSDELTHKFYTTYLNDGLITLGEMDLSNGKIKKRFILKHTFPKNIKVQNGVAYYLYRLKDSEDRMALYAFEID